MVGIYNIVWAGSCALAYFSGGFLLEKFGLRLLFLLPASIHIVQAGILVFLQNQRRTVQAAAAPPYRMPAGQAGLNPRPIARTRCFLRMAWLANPFAYVAINTVVAIVPSLAR